MADLLGIRRLTEGNSFGVVCPYCGDTRGKMNFRIMKDGKPANTYHCFASGCGARGNMLTLYADMKGIFGADRYKTAYRQICDELYGPSGTETQKKKPNDGQHGQEEAPASAEKRDRVYRRLLQLLSLSDEHRMQLMVRGLTDEQIVKYQFCSTPVSGTENLVRHLLQEGYSVAGVPGFYMNGRGNWDVAFYRRNHGVLCPAFGIDGNIEGFQIRLDAPYDGRKYLWLSSSNKKRGAGSKSPVTFLGNPHDQVVRVTEGVLKALVAHSLSGYSFLGTPGVNQYKELEKALAVLKRNGLREVQEYYDMDKQMDIRCSGDPGDAECVACANREPVYSGTVCPKKGRKRNQIQDGCMRLYEVCEKLGLHYVRKVWDRDENGLWAGNYKGIDDYWAECLQNGKEMRYGFHRTATD